MKQVEEVTVMAIKFHSRFNKTLLEAMNWPLFFLNSFSLLGETFKC